MDWAVQPFRKEDTKYKINTDRITKSRHDTVMRNRFAPVELLHTVPDLVEPLTLFIEIAGERIGDDPRTRAVHGARQFVQLAQNVVA